MFFHESYKRETSDFFIFWFLFEYVFDALPEGFMWTEWVTCFLQQFYHVGDFKCKKKKNVFSFEKKILSETKCCFKNVVLHIVKQPVCYYQNNEIPLDMNGLKLTYNPET